MGERLLRFRGAFIKLSLVFLLAWQVIPVAAQYIAINEVMASNATTITDDDGDFSDWIELHNHGSETVELFNYALSDDYDDPYKWVFPKNVLNPGEFLIVWASGKDRKISGQSLHTNFSLDLSGEEVILTRPDGTLVDEMIPVMLPTDISYGRLPEGTGEWRFYTNPSPGEPNPGPGFSFLLDPVDFSANGGAFQNEFFLNLGHTLDDAQIFYTLDGSTPDENSNLFTEPILIRNRQGDPNIISLIPTNNISDPGPPYFEGWQPPSGEVLKVNVVRARAIHPDAPHGPVSTQTYLVHPLANGRFTLPMFSLATDNDNLFDNETGIYVHGNDPNHPNYFQDGLDWERPANLSFFEKDGEMAFNEDVGIRLHGNTTRSRPRKSLRINARAEYGNSWINYRLFPDKPVNQFKRFILRNSGNDWDMSVFRDAMMQHLSKDLHVDIQHYRPAILFINGEYWGIHNIRDRYNHHHIFSHYGIEEDEVSILEDNAVLKFGNPAGRNHFISLRNFISNNNLAVDQNFENVKTRMDLESFTDFQLTHIFVMNTDWPGNNLIYWRYMRNSYQPGAEVRDGRWRWMMLDTDFGFGLQFFYVPGVEQGAAHNTLAFATASKGPGWPNPPWSTLILRKLLANQDYKHYFINRFCDLLNTNFSEEHVVFVIDSITSLLQPEMQEHINRWRRPVSMSSWLQEVQSIRNFALERPSYLRSHINSQFNLSGTITLNLGVNQVGAGDIRVNTIKPELVDGWEGIYFRDVPIQLQAIPRPGYRFVEWTGTFSGSSETLEVTPTGNIQLTAHFEPGNDFAGDAMNPPAYRLANGSYTFSYWDAHEPEQRFPPSMVFQQSAINDPLLADEMTHPYYIPAGEYHPDDNGSVGFPYRLTRRTRINGLYDQGISFINTGRNRDLGAALLAIDTRGLEDITVSWTCGTVLPNSREYAIILQYRIGHEGDFINATDSLGNYLIYNRNENVGHEHVFGPHTLPSEFNNQPYIQLRWKYYYTGIQSDPNSGQRDELRLDDIHVSTLTMNIPEIYGQTYKVPVLEQNYPNPFSVNTTIKYHLPASGHAHLAVYSYTGKKVADIVDKVHASGSYEVTVNADQLSSGLYFLQLLQNDGRATKKMMIAR
jgi:uncharacterized repeat protein (TIGR02543 family)